jgi:hypothetical protein
MRYGLDTAPPLAFYDAAHRPIHFASFAGGGGGGGTGTGGDAEVKDGKADGKADTGGGGVDHENFLE